MAATTSTITATVIFIIVIPALLAIACPIIEYFLAKKQNKFAVWFPVVVLIVFGLVIPIYGIILCIAMYLIYFIVKQNYTRKSSLSDIDKMNINDL